MPVIDFTKMLLGSSDFLKPFAITLTHDSEEAKDLFQETIYRALANKDKYNAGTNLKAWLYTIMRNIFINDYRKKAKQKIVSDISGDTLISTGMTITGNGVLASINIKDIQKAIFNLPDIFKTPFVLYYEGFKYNEIAEALTEPLGTIKSRIHFARKLLKAEIERY